MMAQSLEYRRHRVEELSNGSQYVDVHSLMSTHSYSKDSSDGNGRSKD